MQYFESVIGKFGLGFNSVYNIADSPSIMSGRKLAIFDPNLKYLPDRYKNPFKPGMLIKIDNQDFKKYEDQFRPYHGVFGCNLLGENNNENKFEGTLFRLPFRKFYKVYVLKTRKYFCQKLIEGSELNEQFSTKLDDSVKSIIFYRNTQLPYFTSKNLCSGVLEGLEKYYSQSGVQLQSTADYIIELLIASLQKNEEIYEKVVDENEKFEKFF